MAMVVEEDLKNIQYPCHLSEEQDPARRGRREGGKEVGEGGERMKRQETREEEETQRGGARKGGRGGGRGSVLKADYEQLQQHCTCDLQISISVVTRQEFGAFLMR